MKIMIKKVIKEKILWIVTIVPLIVTLIAIQFMGKKVPEVLTSGHHGKVDEWRRQQSIIRTYNNRPDLLENAKMPVDKNKYRLQVFGAMLLNQPKYQLSFANFTAKNEGDRCTAEEVYENRLSYFTREVLDIALQRAGLI